MGQRAQGQGRLCGVAHPLLHQGILLTSSPLMMCQDQPWVLIGVALLLAVPYVLLRMMPPEDEQDTHQD